MKMGSGLTLNRENTIKISERLRSLSEIYNPSMLSKIINERNFSPIINRINKHRIVFTKNNRKYRFETFLHMLYNKMTKDYRNEYIYKNTILNKILLHKYKLNNTILLSEFKIGKSVADLVLINGNAIVYELKTDLDNLKRLNSQLSEYKKAIDTIYIVTNHKFINTINNLYSDSKIGIIEFTEKNTLRYHKKGIKDSSKFIHETIFKLLRKNEYLDIVEKFFGSVPNVPNTKIFSECLNLIKEIDIIDFQKTVFKKIRERNIIAPQYLINKKTPTELKFACYNLDLNSNGYNNLYKLLNIKI
jgi:hypothetical protein